MPPPPTSTSIVALQFEEELRKIEKIECPKRASAARVLSIVAIVLRKVFKKTSKMQKYVQDVLLLTAPALAIVYKCREQALDLEMIRPFAEEETVKRITAALKEGNILVGNTRIAFEPARQ